MKTRNDIELMAPAGSYESLHAALDGGADAVYFGIGALNMRQASSANFTAADLPGIVDLCHRHDARAYMTLNTVLFDDDVTEMHRMVDAARQCGVDALIVSDMAAIMYARAVGMELHASTQLNIANTEAVRFFAQFCDVMVLAREVSLAQAKIIRDAVDRGPITGPSGRKVRIEMFCHGALCMAVSGKCYLSLHEYNRSANRGACVQVCRHAYTVTDRDTGAELDVEGKYIMSPKDLCTIGFLDRMLDAGVTVLKIEGRARAPEYVRTVTACYDEAVRAWCDGTFTPEKTAAWTERLRTVFNRGFWDGYYLGRRLGEWTTQYGSAATLKKVYAGRCTNYFPRLGVGEFLMEADGLSVGEKVIVTGPTTGVVEMSVQELRTDVSPVPAVQKGSVCSMPVPQRVRRGDRLYRMVPVTE
ncbi:MAG: U32 family peptidase [Bacteroidales bacterium]|nr:U32 family peptidase [Bacteroidales bacterium]